MIRQLGVILLLSFVGSAHAMNRNDVLRGIGECQQILHCLDQQLARAKGDDITRLQNERSSVMGDLCAWQCQLEECERQFHEVPSTSTSTTNGGQFLSEDLLHMRGCTVSPTDILLEQIGSHGPFALEPNVPRASKIQEANSVCGRALAFQLKRQELTRLLNICAGKITACAASDAVKTIFIKRVDAIKKDRDEFYDWKIDALLSSDNQNDIVQMIMDEDNGVDAALFDAVRRLGEEVEAITNKDNV